MSLITLWASFADDWEVGHKVTFDGRQRLIIVPNGVTQLDVRSDIYSASKEWLGIRDNAKYLPPVRTIGGDPTVGNQRAGDIYFLINDWRLVVDLRAVQVAGALFSDDYDTAFYDYDLNPQYPVTVSSLVTTVAVQSTQSIPSPAQNAEAVWSYTRSE